MKWLFKYFVPHEGNEHKPHFLRWEAVLVVLGFIIFVEVVFLIQVLVIFPRTSFFANVLPNVLVDFTNANRASQNFAPLKINPLLEKAAQLKAEDMAKKGYFAHNSPDGLSPWSWFKKAGYNFSYAGENLAVNFFDSQELVDAWLASPLHKQNILNRNFTEIGIGVAKGNWNGREAVFIVQMFGRPAETASILPGKIASAAGETSVNLEEENTKIYSSAAAKIITSPKINAKFLYIMLFSIVLIALMLKIFIKIKIQHPPLIMNGVLLLLVIASMLCFNQLITTLLKAKII